MADDIEPVSVISEVIQEVLDRKRLGGGIKAARERQGDFSSPLEMELAGVAMIPEARALMSERLTKYWDDRPLSRITGSGPANVREWVIGAGYTAAVYCANRVRAGYPRPVVLEQGQGEDVGGAFAVSLNPVFRLNSRNRPGPAGLPDQGKALNYLPGGLIQPSMISSAEYQDNADMAWLIRLTLAQFADVRTAATVEGIEDYDDSTGQVRLITSGDARIAGRVLDARGTGMRAEPFTADQGVLTFAQFMKRMGGMFPLRGMQQAAVIGGGDSARCAVESLLGIAPGHTSAIGLDYVQSMDWYNDLAANPGSCEQFREAQRGRYIAIAQQLQGNVSNRTPRLRVMGERGFATRLPQGAVVNDRTYDMVIRCTGDRLPSLEDGFSYYNVSTGEDGRVLRTGADRTVLATQARPYESYRIGPAAGLPLTLAEERAGLRPVNRVAMFRLGPRTAALAYALKSPGDTS